MSARFIDTPSPRRRLTGAHAVFIAIGSVLSLLFVGPLVLAVVRSLQTEAQIVQPPNADSFSGASLDNYIGIFTRLPFLEMLGNSLLVSLASALATAVIATLAGYGLGRFQFRFQGLVFGVILIALMVPFQVLFTPLYLQFNVLGLTDSRLGLIIFYVTFNLPFAVFIMRNTFAAMPRELEEAAYVDGASVMGTLLHVLRPLALPGVATVIIFTFLACWTEFIGAFLFLTSEDKQTLPIGLLTLIQGGFGGIRFGYVIAGSVISLIPSVILFIALQRYYVQGLAAGSVKN